MFQASKRLWAIPGLAAFCALALGVQTGCRREQPAPSDSEITMLSRGLGAEGELPRDAGRVYGVDLEEGQLLHLTLEQRGADVVVAVLASSGRKRELYRVDSPNGTRGTEEVYRVAVSKGMLRFAVYDASKGKDKGSYRLRIAELRKADDPDRANAKAEEAFYIGKGLVDQKRQQAAEEQFLKAVEIWKGLRNEARQADALQAIARVRFGLKDWKEAAAAYRQCAELRKGLQDLQGQAEALDWASLSYEKLGQFQQAEAAKLEELEIRARLSNVQAENIFSLAKIQLSRGEAAAALSRFNQVIAICRENGDVEGYGNGLGGRGGIYLSMGMLDLALKDFNVALDLIKDENSPEAREARAAILTQKAAVYRAQGEFKKAEKLLGEALAIRIQNRSLAGEGVTLNALGVLYYEMDQIDEALSAFQRAEQIFEIERNVGQQMAAMVNLGWVHVVQDRSELASQIFNKALILARNGENKPVEASLLLGMAYTERKRGNPITALARVDEAIEVVESLRSATDRRDMRTSMFASREDVYAMKIGLLMDQHKFQPGAGHDVQAFQTSERARARVLYEALAEEVDSDAAKPGPELIARHKRLRREINTLDQQLRRPGLSEAQKKEIELDIRGRISQNEEVEARIRSRVSRPESLALLPSLSLWEIQNHVLDPDMLLLEYYMDRERSFLWAVSRTSFQGYELQCPGLRDLAQKSHAFLAGSLSEEQKQRGEADLEQLSHCLFDPVAHLLGSRRLLIVAHDELQKIPFEVLPEPVTRSSGNASRLIMRHEVSSAPSVAVLALLRRQQEQRRPAEKFLALVTDPVYSLDDERLPRAPTTQKRGAGDLEPLQFSRLQSAADEAREILTLVKGQPIEKAMGFQANREWVMAGHLANSQIVHFTTHGLLNENLPEISGLVLSQFDSQGRAIDGLLRTHEIDDLRLNAGLVVLSACQTALGRDVRGEGLVGLTQSFLTGGASMVVVSLWEVDDRATAVLMKHFYHALIKEHLPPPAALKKAKMKMIDDEHWRDPFYWAGLVLQGDWKLREGLRTEAGK